MYIREIKHKRQKEEPSQTTNAQSQNHRSKSCDTVYLKMRQSHPRSTVCKTVEINLRIVGPASNMKIARPTQRSGRLDPNPTLMGGGGGQ
jgi:hypothetical protein